jgi:hypothetical protein
MLLMPDVDMIVGTMLDPSALSWIRVHYDPNGRSVTINTIWSVTFDGMMVDPFLPMFSQIVPTRTSQMQ